MNKYVVDYYYDFSSGDFILIDDWFTDTNGENRKPVYFSFHIPDYVAGHYDKIYAEKIYRANVQSRIEYRYVLLYSMLIHKKTPYYDGVPFVLIKKLDPYRITDVEVDLTSIKIINKNGNIQVDVTLLVTYVYDRYINQLLSGENILVCKVKRNDLLKNIKKEVIVYCDNKSFDIGDIVRVDGIYFDKDLIVTSNKFYTNLRKLDVDVYQVKAIDFIVEKLSDINDYETIQKIIFHNSNNYNYDFSDITRYMQKCIFNKKINVISVKKEDINHTFLIATNLRSDTLFQIINIDKARFVNTYDDDLYNSLIGKYQIVSKPCLVDFESIPFPITKIPMLIFHDS